ncbi:hypothetical protein [Ligilactobacillus ruminis]|uniref:hypothetical protein n=1 Tax=Ligilactobacillus ruminis TaxID=1623 RepID=UPI0022E2B19E|nr:hypothetical protein [Ligilactobacillus ruminis]
MKNDASNLKTGSFAINRKSDPVFCVCMTIAFHEENNQKQCGDTFDRELGSLILQALHLSKSLPFTDTSLKMDALSVNLSEILAGLVEQHFI